MVRLWRPANRPGFRPVYYVAAYWVLNIGLVVAEAKWHLIFRLMIWDLTQLRALGFFGQLAHPAAPPPHF
jgi:hypothetical protein